MTNLILVSRDIFYQYRKICIEKGTLPVQRKLSIPDPVLEENRDQYLEELAKISEAEDWIEKHSVTVQRSEEVEHIIKSRSQILEVTQDNTKPNIGLFMIISVMFMLSFYIIYIPSENTKEFCFLFLLFSIGFIPFQKSNHRKKMLNEKNQSKLNQITNEENNYFLSKPFTIFLIGFSLPFSIWSFLFLSLGEPCVIFSCSRYKWVFWDAFLPNIFFGFIVLITAISDSITNKRMSGMLFFLGFCLGSFFGIGMGEWLITSPP